MRTLTMAAALAAMMLPVAAGSAAGGKAAGARDWRTNIAATPEGGIAMGNPAAKVTLVEYGSLACSHCKHFADEAMAAIGQDYVRGGKLRFEYRNYVLNGYDAAAVLLARCAGPGRFFAQADRFYATQDEWLGRAQDASAADKKALGTMAPSAMMGAMARIAGLREIAAKAGLAPARANACLADGKALDALVARTEAAHAKGVRGTPTFFINGERVEGSRWAQVKPAIEAALRR